MDRGPSGGAPGPAGGICGPSATVIVVTGVCAVKHQVGFRGGDPSPSSADVSGRARATCDTEGVPAPQEAPR